MQHIGSEHAALSALDVEAQIIYCLRCVRVLEHVENADASQVRARLAELRAAVSDEEILELCCEARDALVARWALPASAALRRLLASGGGGRPLGVAAAPRAGAGGGELVRAGEEEDDAPRLRRARPFTLDDLSRLRAVLSHHEDGGAEPVVAAVRQLSETTLPFAKVLERQLAHTEHLRHGGTLAIRVALAHVKAAALKCVPHALRGAPRCELAVGRSGLGARHAGNLKCL